MDRDSLLKEHIATQASEWFVRLQEGEQDPMLRAEFTQWLLRSPGHVEEFLAISRVWGESKTASTSRFPTDELIAAALARPIDNVIELKPAAAALKKEEGEAAQHGPFALRKLRYAAAAAVVTLALGALAWLAADRWLGPSIIRTAIGEQRSVTLADGSVVDVNTNSELRVDLSDTERRLRLLKGEARFKVAKNLQRPFIVSTSQASIRALGTVFNVRAESEQTAVAVLEGHVEVRELARPHAALGSLAQIQLRAGQQAAVKPAGGIVPDAGPPIERVTEWTHRRLVFREEPLSEVVAEFNRYHRKPIRIETRALAGLRISGTFDSSDPNSLLEYFQRFENVRVAQDSESIRLSMPLPAPAP
jgi:transmembrane sensor